MVSTEIFTKGLTTYCFYQYRDVRVARYGREITLILCGIQLAQTMYHVYLEHGVFNWANGININEEVGATDVRALQKRVVEEQAHYILKGKSAWLATGFCSLILIISFIIPMVVLLKYAITYFDQAWSSEFFSYACSQVQWNLPPAI